MKDRSKKVDDKKYLRVAMPAWEIGRSGTNLGTQIGGLGVVIEELPGELVKAAARQGVELEVEILSPCFAHFDKSKLTLCEEQQQATIAGSTFTFEVYEYTFPDGQKVIYFWDDWQLHWTDSNAIYPDDPQMALTLFASINQAMANYIRKNNYDTVHLHDYHVGLIPFYLGDHFLQNVPVHFTIHNASYQGIIPLIDGGYSSLDRINLHGEQLFHRYFDFFDNLNLMKGCMLKVHENGGKITTVSGDLSGSWGYAAELKEGHSLLTSKAKAQKGSPPVDIFVPNRHLDVFEKLPIAGITNGLHGKNRAVNLPELKATVLKKMQKKSQNRKPLFENPVVQDAMLSRNHNFTVGKLHIKKSIKRLLHLEAFGSEPDGEPILLTAVGRLVDQKNFSLITDIIERTLYFDPGCKFIILASATSGDSHGKGVEARFFRLASKYPHRVYFNNSFHLALAKLILAGGDFTLIPSRFEPCGLVDYEASLLGNIVIGRATGGLTKVRHCAYLYDWLDIGDRTGEAKAFFEMIQSAISIYRSDAKRHIELINEAMRVRAGWDTSADHYINMYRFGLLMKKWQSERRQLIHQFVQSLEDDRQLFSDYFMPGQQEYSDAYDWELRDLL